MPQKLSKYIGTPDFRKDCIKSYTQRNTGIDIYIYGITLWMGSVGAGTGCKAHGVAVASSTNQYYSPHT